MRSSTLLPVLLLAAASLLAVAPRGADAAVVTFTGGNYTGWETWDWDAITHLGFWTNPSDEVHAKARASGVRLFGDAGLPDKATWTNESAREEFAAAMADKVRKHNLDGVFFDYEGNDLNKDQKAAYPLLAAAVTKAIAPLNGTIFICVGGRPTYEFRDYPYADLAAASEFLFIMGYDMHFWDDYTCVLKGTCSAAEASIKDVRAGVEAYASIVAPEKLVLGLPWYGQRYLKIVLPINYGQIDYVDVLAAMDTPGLVTEKTLDNSSMSWVIKCSKACDLHPGKRGNLVYFDDATTLKPKYALARDAKLLGVGMWKVDDLPVPSASGSDPHKAEREAMWSAIAAWNAAPGLTAPLSVMSSSSAAAEVRIVQSSEVAAKKGGQPDRFSPKPPVAFSPTKGSCDGHCPTVSVDPTKRRQSIKGFGGAFTDSVADVFFQLNASLQDEVIEHLWGANGQQLSLARLTIGSTDFSTTVYNYNPTPDDYAQSNFSIEHDLKQIIPLVHKAQAAAAARPAANRQLDFLSSPWSPPGWMKRPYLSLKGKMRNSAKPGMVDDPKIYASYALYTSKYLSAYKQAGINVSMVTIQNEPDSADHMFPVAYPACNFNGTGEGEYLRDYLGPQLRKDHPDVKIFIHDGQKFHDVPILTRVEAILQALGDKAKDYVDGVAFHWYGNNLKNYQFLQALRDAHPELLLMGTEATLEAPARQHLGTSPWKEAQKYGIDIIGDLNAGATGWIEWNVLLDSGGGPTCIGSTTGTDCTPLIGHCDAPILADTKKQTLEIRDSYYFMGHFSRYIPPGSTNIDLSGATDTNTTFVATAVETPAGDVVVVAVNSDDKNSVQFNLELHGQYALIEIPPHSVQTLTVPASVARAMREQLAQPPLMEQIRGQVE